MPDVVHIASPTGVVIAADHWDRRRGNTRRARPRWGSDPPLVGRHGRGARRRRAPGRLDGSARPRRLDVGAGPRLHDDAFRDDALAVADWVGRTGRLGRRVARRDDRAARGRRTTRGVRALVLVDITPHPAKPGVDRILGFMGANAEDGFATLDEAADAIAAYQPHRHATEGPVGPRQEPAPRRGRPLALALGPGVPRHPHGRHERARPRCPSRRARGHGPPADAAHAADPRPAVRPGDRGAGRGVPARSCRTPSTSTWPAPVT